MRASLALQRAVVAALSADVALGQRALRLYDGPPADARPPYLSVGSDTVSDWGFKGGEGRIHRFQVTLWDARDGVAATKEVLAEVEAAILAMPRSFEGVRLVTLRLTKASVKRSAKSWTQGTLEFRALSVTEAPEP